MTKFTKLTGLRSIHKRILLFSIRRHSTLAYVRYIFATMRDLTASWTWSLASALNHIILGIQRQSAYIYFTTRCTTGFTTGWSKHFEYSFNHTPYRLCCPHSRHVVTQWRHKRFGWAARAPLGWAHLHSTHRVTRSTQDLSSVGDRVRLKTAGDHTRPQES